MSLSVRSGLNNMMPSEHEMMVFNTMAKQAVESKMYRGIGDVAGVMMAMLSARELGIPPMQALNGGINIINGKIEISARMMSAMIRRAGHRITVQESTESSCTLVGTRQDTGDTATVSYTLQEAKNAGLVKPNGGWVKNPKDMCFARAMSRLARQLFSDVIGIGYVEGEIKASEDTVIVETIAGDHSTFDEVKQEDLDKAKLWEIYEGFFDALDRNLAHEYLQTVMKHFSWTEEKTLQELIKDSAATLRKFNTWKDRISK